MASPSRRATVLVVEDDRALRTFYQSALMMAGHTVITAQDGIEALRKIDTSAPDVVVLDLGLPLLSGRDVFRELEAHPQMRGIPIIVVTGSDPSDLDPQRFVAILRKPVTPDALMAAVGASLHRIV